MIITQRRAWRLLALLTVILAAATFIFTFVPRVLAFAQLFGVFGEHSGTKITQVEIATRGADGREPVVPRILHQIFHNWRDPNDDRLPEDWEEAHQTCVLLNPEWEHKLWTSRNSRKFIEEQYPWFLPTYDGYRYPIQRVDALKYFILRHYGGIYIDLDNGCAESLDPLRYYPAFTTDGGMGALSNNILGGQPEHPWFHLLTNNLIPYDWNWLLPYVVVMYCTGQWYVTAIFEKYHSLLAADGTVRGFDGVGWAPLHHILMDGRPGADPWVFFTQSSLPVLLCKRTWEGRDAQLVPPGLLHSHPQSPSTHS
ncbi:hypothetical protein SAPIO_CDS6649 [Scedosporium apiospermum]|uniref:Mannosyl phosphorylinositol ceramide synthase SUR1 n=1 Tax=Pseudallescheria apiosperma TaxID=563466 RepID=A0A084G3D1_PSEDA|nr:uncharacterized protein SAPIO_CDS6649 [Scedosporium apiospermum]KEZ41843.1 hypothetical protein SAPIO_CDS6649 [Scedosporium apiospermum]